MSDSLRPHELQHARPPCWSLTPGVHSDSRPSSQWCHPAISSSVVPFSCPQSLSASEYFPMSQLFAWGGQSTGVSALASLFPKKPQGWSLLGNIKLSLWSGCSSLHPHQQRESSCSPASPTLGVVGFFIVTIPVSVYIDLSGVVICSFRRTNGTPLQYSCLENPREGESHGLQSTGSHRVRHNWSDLAAAAAARFESSDCSFFLSILGTVSVLKSHLF